MKDEGGESWCTIFRCGEEIRLTEMTKKLKCFSGMTERLGCTSKIREMIVQMFQRDIECSGKKMTARTF